MNRAFVVLGTPAQALDELGNRRRQDEDARDIAAHLAIDLQGSLDVDVEEIVAPGFERGFDRLARRAVKIAMHLRPFEKLAALAQSLEAALVDEVVMHAVDLARPAWPRGDGNRKRELIFRLQQETAQSRFARP